METTWTSNWRRALTAWSKTQEQTPTMKSGLDLLMTEAQEAHLQRIKDAVGADLDAKYRAGQHEHGGNLFEKPGMLEAAYEEALDLCIYLRTEIDNRRAGRYPNGRDT